MTLWLKQSTARTIHIGPFVDDTDGKTAETGLTLSQADIRLSKNGGDIAQKNEASACTHDELGYYTCALDTTDTNTLGHLKLMVHEAGALPVFMDFMVVPANVWDSMFGADVLDVSVTQIAGSAVDTAAAQLGVNVVNWKGAAAAAMTGDAYARLGAPAGASVSADIADIHTDVADVHTDVGTAITAIGDVHATDLPAVASMLTDIHGTDLPAVKADTAATLAAVDTEVAAILVAVDTEIAAIKAKTDNLPAAPAATGDIPSAATVASQVRTELSTELGRIDAAVTSRLASGSYTAPDNAGIAAVKAKTDNLPSDPADESLLEAAISGLNDLSSADVQTAAAAALTAYDPPTRAEATADKAEVIAALPAAAPSASAVADAVWDEAIAGHAGAGSTGAALAGATAPTAGAVADAVWDEAMAGHAGAGSAGAALAAAGSAGDPWSTALPGAYGAGTAGKVISDMADDVPLVKAKTDTIGTLSVTVTSPVASSGAITIYAGDDYDAAHGREISLAVTDATHALGLDDPAAVVSLKCPQATWTGTAVSTAGGYTVTFEPTAAQTAVLTIARQTYELEATLADGDVVTLATGTLTVHADIP